MGATYHVTIDLRWALRQKDALLATVFRRKDGSRLSGPEARALCEEMFRQRYDMLPVCDHHDASGACLGHAPDATPGTSAPAG